MITLKIGANWLDMGNAKITVEILNQLLQVGIVRDNFTYSFTIPNTAKNEEILGSVGKIASTNMHQDEFSCGIYLFGVLTNTGVLIVEEATPLEIKIKIDFDWGAFSRELGDKKLKDFYDNIEADSFQVIPSTTTGYRYYFQSIFWIGGTPPSSSTGPITTFEILKNGTQVAFHFVVYPTTVEVIADGLRDSFNANAAVNGNFVAYKTMLYGSPNIHILPFGLGNTDTFQLRINQSDPANIFPPTTDTYTFSAIDETRPILSKEYTHICFPTILAENFYDGKNPDFLGVLNKYTSAYWTNSLSQFPVASPNLPANYNDYAHCPCIKLFSVIQKIISKVGWTWAGDLKTDTTLSKLLIYSNYATDSAVQIGDYTFNEHERVVLYSNLVPDMTAKEFFEQLQELFCLYYTFDATNKIIYIDFKKDVFNSAVVQNLNTKYLPKREIIEHKKNIQLEYKEDLDIKTYYPSPSAVGNYTLTETISLRTGAMPYNLPAYPAIWTKKGNSKMFGVGENNNKSKMYLFFWRDLVSIQGENMPVAEGKERATFYGSLDFAETNGINSYFESYINYLLYNKVEEGIIWLSLDDISRMLRSLALKYRYGNLPFLIENIQAEVDSETKNIIGAKIKIRKVPL